MNDLLYEAKIGILDMQDHFGISINTNLSGA